MRKTPLWLRRLVVGGVSAVTVGGVGFASLIGTAGAASATSTVTGTRLAGPNRFATAAAIAAETFPKGAATVIVANGLSDHLPDSLAASYLAAQENGGAGAPILLVNTDSVPSETSAELTALGAKNVVIVGGTAAVSTGVQTTLAKSYTVTRVSGADRFATADAVDSQSGMTNVKTVNGKKYAIVADGVNGHLVDSLGSSPISYAENFPVLLVNGPTGVLSSADLAILKADGINDVLIIGGTAAVGTQVDTQLTTAGYTPLRPAEGVNRSQTSELLAEYAIANFGFVNTHFNVASGSQDHLVDSLSGGPHSGSEKAPTLITDTVDNPGFVSDFATKNSATESSFHVFGGTDAISDANEAAIIKAAETAPSVVVTTLPQLESAKVLSTDSVLGTTVQYTFSQPVLTANGVGFHLYSADGTTEQSGTTTSATVQSGGTTVDVVFSALTSTTDGKDASDINNYTLATVSSTPGSATAPPAVATGSGAVNPDGSAAIGSSATTTLTPGKTNAPNLVSVGNYRTSGGNTFVDFTFDSAPTPVTAADGASFHLVNTDGTEAAGTVGTTPTVVGDVVTVQFTGTTEAQATTARGYVDAATQKGSNGDSNALEAVAVSNGGITTNADLKSATLEPSTNQVLYTFDQTVTSTDTAAALGADFGVFQSSGTQTQGNTATIGGSGSTQVLVTFTGDTFANVVGANVKTDALTNINADSASVSNTNVSSTAAGTIDAPQLSGVALSTTTNGFGVTSYSATYTFTQALLTTTALSVTQSGDFHLYESNGTELTGTNTGTTAGCAFGAAGSNGTVTTVVCTSYGTGTSAAAPAGTEVLGTVDATAVTGAASTSGHTNPEGAQPTTGGTGTPA